MIATFERHGFGIFALIGAFQQALTRVQEGDLEALDGLTATVAAWRKDLAADVWCPYLLAELAAAQARAGRRSEAYASLKDAMDYVEVTGADFYTAEVLRIRGELRCEDGDPGGLADLQAAVDKAHDQGAEAFLRRAEESQRAARELAPS
jgi:hypothetical protein